MSPLPARGETATCKWPPVARASSHLALLSCVLEPRPMVGDDMTQFCLTISPRPALVAQWIEHRFPKPGVGGSIPPGGTSDTSHLLWRTLPAWA
jgi:hypothetical protein